MIVFDLICHPHSHKFEGWFASSSDFDEQRETGLLSCPICDSSTVKKALMAPNVGAKSNQSYGSLVAPTENIDAPAKATAIEPKADVALQNVPSWSPEIETLVGKIAEAQSQMLEKSEWVGRDFAENARAIHYGEQDEKLIHGEASPEEASALDEEGISVAPLLVPFVPPESQN